MCPVGAPVGVFQRALASVLWDLLGCLCSDWARFPVSCVVSNYAGCYVGVWESSVGGEGASVGSGVWSVVPMGVGGNLVGVLRISVECRVGGVRHVEKRCG